MVRHKLPKKLWPLWCVLAFFCLGAAAPTHAGSGLGWKVLLAMVGATGLAFAVEAVQGKNQEGEPVVAETSYRGLFQTSPQAMWIYDAQSLEILAANEAASRLYGYTSEEFLKLHLQDLLEGPPKPDREKRGHAALARSHRRKDGSEFPVDELRREVVFDKRKAVLVVASDNTANQWAERRATAFSDLARRLTSARTPIDTAKILMDTAEQLFGWDACTFDLCVDSEDAVQTVLYMDTVNGQRVDVSSQCSGEPGPQTQQAMKQGAFLILRPTPKLPAKALPFGDKSRASASLMFAPIRQSGHVIGVLSIQSYRPNAYTQKDLSMLQDLGDLCGATLERIRVEEELLRLNTELERRVTQRTAQLEAINRELEAFSYSVSHDLRAPLRSIRGFSEVVLERYCAQLDPPAQEFLRRSCESSRQMDALIEALLELSRVGRSQMKVNPVDLTAVAESVAAELRKTDPNRTVEFVIAPALKATGDERLLRIALTNLFENAWKFTAKQPAARIEFGHRNGEAPAFFVQDNGAGFDMSYATKLFGVFQRLHTASEFPGTGVGLATVQRIINRHGGRTWATSELNKGATFFFTLPSGPDFLS